jgi:hypothetical protein
LAGKKHCPFSCFRLFFKSTTMQKMAAKSKKEKEANFRIEKNRGGLTGINCSSLAKLNKL